MKVQGIAAPAKEWSWSYSKLKNFDVCPKRHYEVDVLKNFNDNSAAGSAGLEEGNAAHDSLAKACSGKLALPERFKHYQKWVDRVQRQAAGGKLLVEQKYAITRDFRPTTYFAKDVWLRVIADIVILQGPVAITSDWKTGKVLEDSVQLMLVAQGLFSHYPQLQRVGTEFVWLKEECTSPEVFTRQEVADQWVELLSRVAALEHASKTLTYPPKPGPFCKKYCPVESCPFWRKGTR